MKTDEFESDCELNVNIEILCRICLESKGSLQNIFIQEIIDGQLIPLPRIFQKVLQVKIIKNDKLPQKICTSCKAKLIEYQKFKAKCESSHKILHDVLNPGYDFRLESSNTVAEKFYQNKNDAQCQTEDCNSDVEYKPDEQKETDQKTLKVFQDALEHYDLLTKAIDLLETVEDEDDLYNFCRFYGCFTNGSQCPYCSKSIPDVAFLHSHMKDNHNDLLLSFTERLNAVEIVSDQAMEDVKYETVETEEIIEIEELEEDDCYTIKHEENNEEVTIIVADPQSESYHCPICHKLLRGDEIEKHKLLHRDVLPLLFESIEHYICGLCNTVFISVEQVKNHFSSDEIGYTCNVPTTPSKLEPNEEFQSLPEIPQNMFVFGRKSQVDADTGLVSDQTCVEMEEVQMPNTPEATLICGICQKAYSTVVAMRYHTFNHFASYDCPLKGCEAHFDFAYKLLAHYKYVHLKDRVDPYFQCPHCKEVLDNKKEYLFHMKETCTKRTISCEQCSKKFFNTAALKNHMKTHEKLVHCEECDAVFQRNAELKNHMRTSHLGEKLYKCSICDKRFRTPSHRSDHEQTHNTENKFQCEFCQSMYKSERVLKAHKKIHFGRSHACPICGKYFNRNYHVKLHMKIHGNMKSKLEDLQMTY